MEERLRTLTEAECYERCYGWRWSDDSVKVLRREPDLRDDPSELGERLRRLLELRLDEREVTTVPVLEVPRGSLERHMERLGRVRRERDAGAVEAALNGLRDAASRPGSSETNLMPHFIRCAEAYATLGEQCGVLRAVFGEYREPVAV